MINTELINKVNLLLNKIEREYSQVGSELSTEITEIRKIASQYDQSFYKHDLSPYFLLRKDFKIIDDIVTPKEKRKGRTATENALRKTILINALYFRFNLDRKQIEKVCNNTRANVLYHLKIYQDRIKYDPKAIALQKEFDTLIASKYSKSNLVQYSRNQLASN